MASVCRRESLCLIVPDSQSQEVRHVSSYKFDGRQRLSQIIEYLAVSETFPENYLLESGVETWSFSQWQKFGYRERGSSSGFKESLYGILLSRCDSQPRSGLCPAADGVGDSKFAH